MPSRHSKLKVGFIGAGNIVRTRHLPALKKLADLEIVAVCNSSYESSERFCQECAPNATPYSNWAELVADPDIDIAWIGTPPYLHSTISVSALEAGKHVFCQARMAMNLAEAEEMHAAALRNPHLVTMVCPPPHGLKGSLFIRKLMADRFIGVPHHLRLQSLSDVYINPDAPLHWRQRDEFSGLNVLKLGIYAEVIQRWFGPITHVFAEQKIITPIRQGYEIRIPDLVVLLCRLENGILCVMEFSGVAPFAPAERLEIYGSEGMLAYDFSNEAVYGGRTGQKVATQIEIPSDLIQDWSVEEDFIAAVRSPGTIHPQPDFAEGTRYMKVVQAASDSAASGREIAIA
jgi:predicted dehydrogenase